MIPSSGSQEAYHGMYDLYDCLLRFWSVIPVISDKPRTQLFYQALQGNAACRVCLEDSIKNLQGLWMLRLLTL